MIKNCQRVNFRYHVVLKPLGQIYRIQIHLRAVKGMVKCKPWLRLGLNSRLARFLFQSAIYYRRHRYYDIFNIVIKYTVIII